MNRLKLSRLLRLVGAFLLIVTLHSNVVNAQVQTPRYGVSIDANSGGFYEYLPKGYSSGTQTYPLIVFIHGIGETGSGNTSDLPKLLVHGPPMLASKGLFPASVTV